MHHERYLAPYNGGAELAGCGGGMSAFAQKPRLNADDIDSLAQRLGETSSSEQFLRASGGGLVRQAGNLPLSRYPSTALALALHLVTKKRAICFQSVHSTADWRVWLLVQALV